MSTIGGLQVRSTKNVITPDTKICALVYAPPKFGKALDPDSPVLTTTGWKAIGNLRRGEELASIDGQPSTVIGVYPQRRRDVYKVHFRDGREVTCCGEHLWTVRSREWAQPSKTVTTTELQRLNNLPSHNNRLAVPRPTGDWGNTATLPINPWILGYLLGNGSFRGSSITVSTKDVELVQIFERVLKCQLTKHSAYDYCIADGGKLRHALQALNLFGHRSEAKFIPSAYLNARRSSRLALLQGLIDSDGTVEKSGAVSFSSSSEQLAKDTQQLAWSLGAIANITSRVPSYTYNNESLQGLTHYRVGIVHEDPGQFISLARKLDRVTNTYKTPRLTITDVEHVGKDEAVCIAVTHPSQLYITKDFVPTHNTRLGATLHEMTLRTMGKPTLFIAVEAGEGGGTMSIQDFDVPFVTPGSLNELERLAAELTTDRTYGGIVIDSATELVNRFIKPYALKFPSREKMATREAGVPEQSDYQTMAEKLREILNRFINITAAPDKTLRKHLYVTATEKEKTDRSTGRITAIQPELPGAMAGAATAMMQTVGYIGVRQQVVDSPDKPGQKLRVTSRVLLTDADGVRIAGDRTRGFPAEGPLDFVQIWDKYWWPRVQQLQQDSTQAA
jgi:hypothetical protein